jgi:NADPH2:quinone reductase
VAAGARVIAVAGGPDKVALCRSLGAEFVVDHQRDDLWESVMGFTDGRGVDVACDMVGGDGTETVWTCMAHSGRYVPVGFNDDAQSGMTGRPLRRVSMGNFSVVGVVMGYSDAPAPLRRFGFNPFPPHKGPVVQSALVDLIDAGSIRPYVGRRISFDEVAQTLEDHDQRRTMGRSVLDCSRA